MRRVGLAAAVISAAIAASGILLAWPGTKAEFSIGRVIGGNGPSRPLAVSGWADYGLVPYLVVRSDHDRNYNQLRWYEARPDRAGVTVILLAAVWVTAARLLGVARA